jgi:hypothetical protein
VLASPVSETTESDEILKLAKKWIGECTKTHQQCVNVATSQSEPRLPTRLVDISTLHKGYVRLVVTRRRRTFDKQYWICKARSLLSVLLREKGSRMRISGPYMTLSHCWGGKTFIKLNRSNINRFLWEGIPVGVEEMPRTFRDAMNFTSRLGQRYIWIDSLCIIQKDESETDKEAQRLHEIDWAEESKHMHEIYGGSFCNISATDAKDGDDGLFHERSIYRSWSGLVPVKVQGIPGYVDKGPLNRRGWVLQERLMAPRVLHFCKDQIAWECCQHDAAECQPDGIETFRIDSARMHRPGRLKGLDPKIDGMRLHSDRVKAKGPVVENETQIGALEIWRRIVEVYSKTELTEATDKLIALSGMAKKLQPQIQTEYLAGLWERNLPGQLLWYIDPTFEWVPKKDGSPHKQEGIFSYPGKRPRNDVYRAPTWSWASVDVPRHGLVYGAITTIPECQVEILECLVKPHKASDSYGLLESSSLRLKGVLKPVALVKKTYPVNGRTSLRFHWEIRDGRDTKDIYRNVYVDCPDDDLTPQFAEDQAFCLPVGVDDQENFCYLLLRHVLRDTYKRLGLIRIPTYDSEGRDLLKSEAGTEKSSLTIV